MATTETERINSASAQQLAPQGDPAAAVVVQPVTAAPAPATVQMPTAEPAPEPVPQPDPADKLRAEFAEIASVAAQAARLGVTVDAADAVRKGISADALRRSVLDALAARTEATSVIAAAPAMTAAVDSPIVRLARRHASEARA
jgi:hypothetical protein